MSNLNSTHNKDPDMVSENATEPEEQAKTIQEEKTAYFLMLDVSRTAARNLKTVRQKG